MTFLLAASDPRKIQRLSAQLSQAGIHFEVRNELPDESVALGKYRELWVADGLERQYTQLLASRVFRQMQ